MLYLCQVHIEHKKNPAVLFARNVFSSIKVLEYQRRTNVTIRNVSVPPLFHLKVLKGTLQTL